MTVAVGSMSAQDVLDARGDVFDAILGLDGDLLQHQLLCHQQRYGNDSLVADVLIPVLRHVGDMWESGKLGVLHEHHASGIIRSVVGSFRRPSFTANSSTSVLLACPPGELHDLPIHLFSLMLLDRGLAPVVLGANTPWKALAAAARSNDCAVCVLSGINPRRISRVATVLTTLNAATPLFLAGPLKACHIDGIGKLSDDWRHAAAAITAVAAHGIQHGVTSEAPSSAG